MSPSPKHTERAPSVGEGGKRRFIYPLRLKGYYATIRQKIAYVLFFIYCIAPWVVINGKPFVRLDIKNDHFWVLFSAWRLTDAIYFLFIPLFLVLVLFAATAIKGRIWCGYACPQTVFLDWLIRPIEDFIEGNAYKRKNQDKRKKTPSTIFKKISKHAIFMLLAFGIGNTALMFFSPPSDVLVWMLQPPSEHPVAFSAMLFVSALFYLDFAWFREQFCSFVCPYARFQAVLMDSATPTVHYHYPRGEPRGRRGDDKGDCIDCGLCVRVCPTGIDIRKGPQLECIQCLRCVDACDSVMTSLKRSPRLIEYVSPSVDQANRVGTPVKRVRGRLVLYTGLFAILTLCMAFGLWSRPQVDIRFVRQAGAPYAVYEDGTVGNFFRMVVANTTGKPQSIAFDKLTASATIICGSCQESLAPYERAQWLVVFKVPVSFAENTIRFAIKNHTREFSIPILKPGEGSE